MPVPLRDIENGTPIGELVIGLDELGQLWTGGPCAGALAQSFQEYAFRVAEIIHFILCKPFISKYGRILLVGRRPYCHIHGA